MLLIMVDEFIPIPFAAPREKGEFSGKDMQSHGVICPYLLGDYENNRAQKEQEEQWPKWTGNVYRLLKPENGLVK
jgi:hypothetical protein